VTQRVGRLLLAKNARGRGIDPRSEQLLPNFANFSPTQAVHVHGEFVNLRHAGQICDPTEVRCTSVTSLQMHLNTPNWLQHSIQEATHITKLPLVDVAPTTALLLNRRMLSGRQISSWKKCKSKYAKSQSGTWVCAAYHIAAWAARDRRALRTPNLPWLVRYISAGLRSTGYA
jgi:hypothetical protein